jgi:hypothetical protein
MFIGHFALGLGAKKAAAKVSLGTLFMAVQFLDLLWPTLLLFGWEHVTIQPGNTKMTPLAFTYYPFSHSLLMACVWGLILGLGYYLIKRNKRGSIVVGLCVVSHWVLDLIVHGTDLPLFPGNSTLVGFGLWNHKVLEVVIELSIFIIGLTIYLRNTKAINKTGRFGFWSLIIFLILIHLGNLFGPPPTNTTAIAWAGELQWLFVLWAYWADKNRVSRGKLSTDEID